MKSFEKYIHQAQQQFLNSNFSADLGLDTASRLHQTPQMTKMQKGGEQGTGEDKLRALAGFAPSLLAELGGGFLVFFFYFYFFFWLLKQQQQLWNCCISELLLPRQAVLTPRQEGDDRKPALMQQHCSAAGWSRTPNPKGKAQKKNLTGWIPKAAWGKIPSRKKIISEVRSFNAASK